MRIVNNYTPISKADASAMIRALTGIEPVWAVRTWQAQRGAWDVMCCSVPAAPVGRLAVAVYRDGELIKRMNVL